LLPDFAGLAGLSSHTMSQGRLFEAFSAFSFVPVVNMLYEPPAAIGNGVLGVAVFASSIVEPLKARMSLLSARRTPNDVAAPGAAAGAPIW
jgi:hypothetical protein